MESEKYLKKARVRNKIDKVEYSHFVNNVQLHVIKHDTDHMLNFPKLKFIDYGVSVNKPIYLVKKELPIRVQGERKIFRREILKFGKRLQQTQSN